MVFNGHKLDVTGTITNYGSIHVDTGTLNNAATTGTTTVGNGSSLYLGLGGTGGTISNTGGSALTFATNIYGYGSISGISIHSFVVSGGVDASLGRRDRRKR